MHKSSGNNNEQVYKMKQLYKFTLIVLFAGFSTGIMAQSASDAQARFKKHINSVVEKVQSTDEAVEKRAILNNSFENLIGAIEKVESMKAIPEADKEGLVSLKDDILEKKDELNGENGFRKVPNNSLNDFANFVQQDLEQADSTVTISVTTLLLVILILILL